MIEEQVLVWWKEHFSEWFVELMLRRFSGEEIEFLLKAKPFYKPWEYGAQLSKISSPQDSAFEWLF